MHTSQASEHGVRGYPTKFSGASKSRSSAAEYDGEKTADDFVPRAEDKAVAILITPEITKVSVWNNSSYRPPSLEDERPVLHFGDY